MVIRTFLLIGLLMSSACVVTVDGIGEANYVDLNRSEPAGDEELVKASLDVNVGQIEVEPGSTDTSFELDMHYNELAFEPQVEFNREAGIARLSIELEGGGKSFRGLGDNTLFLKLRPDVPLELETNTGIGECNINLTGMKVQSVELQSGVGETKLTMLEPNRITCENVEIASGVGELELVGLGNLAFEELEFRGGIGEATLDFSGTWDTIGEIEIEVGAGSIEILLPRDIGAEVRVSKTFLSDFDLPRFEKKGDTYYSDNLDRASKVIKFRINAGIGHVELDWI